MDEMPRCASGCGRLVAPRRVLCDYCSALAHTKTPLRRRPKRQWTEPLATAQRTDGQVTLVSP